uniref:Uncharacterized protein n=1 Tax=Acrobeloides nanus TaxID=290746 RepID=A0A914E9A9_9BILA
MYRNQQQESFGQGQQPSEQWKGFQVQQPDQLQSRDYITTSASHLRNQGRQRQENEILNILADHERR